MLACVPLREDLPVDPTPRHTADLPPTPVRDRFIPATAWIEAPPELLGLGADIGRPHVGYIRRIGRWLLWRAGPAAGGDARYMAVADGAGADGAGAGDSAGGGSPGRPTYRLYPDGAGEGPGADGVVHQRFRAWKESLRDF